ncbi:guanylate-binding protein 1 isoform X1 [Rhipicephalus sanguineus]|uniref:guanylate-binding protein 1 isoform X1 n=2 Tax=Rhipicephalus sanguineus TaxID=34632 RepID=UPI0018934ED5|nr:guanylate-binding protein 1 isoform X1 [Rhipicephalus sanguineus]
MEEMGATWAPGLKHPVWFVPLALIFSLLFSPMNASLQSYALNDAPVQIIKPSEDHKTLIIDKENIKAIYKIKGPVATIGVVGKFHSGKSFLMNQLMGKTKGFGIGPSVQPETMGIWMWGEPLKVQLPSGQQLSLIFLDTEGFAATNVSENYDAKIFAIATLISSHLIYNSVKIIDQSEIDYLELLSRRTQLFALRSQLSQAKWKGELVHDLLSFPPLLWVVQDFVQATINNETPTQWLHRLMETHTRESEEYKISLLDLFKSLECHTLFIPAFKRPLLTDLSQASEEDLTEEYIEERNALTKKLHEVLVPKTKNGKPITGAELAGLLQILVDAANEGSLADVPSRWSAFVDRLMSSAADDCLKIYISDMDSLLEKHNNGPIHDDLFMAQHTEAKKTSFILLRQLLHGLPDALSTASSQLTKMLDNDFAFRKEMNSKRIKLFCTSMRDKYLLDAEGYMKSIPLPTTSATLEVTTSGYINSLLEAFARELLSLLPEEDIANYKNSLKQSLNLLVDSIQLKNERAVNKLFENCMATAKDVMSSKVTLTGFLSDAQFERLKKSGVDAAFEAFDLECGNFSSETAYGLHEAKLKVSLNDFIKRIKNENDDLVQQHMAETVKALLTKFEEKTGPDYMPLPMNTSELDLSLKREKSNTESQFAGALEDFQSSSYYSQFFEELMRKLSEKSKERHKENVKAFAQVVDGPLSKARQIILLSSHNYRTEFGLQSYIMQVCLVQLEDGKAKHWHEDLKKSIIMDFMNADPDLAKALRDVKGFWSSILGFFLWFFWMLGIKL